MKSMPRTMEGQTLSWFFPLKSLWKKVRCPRRSMACWWFLSVIAKKDCRDARSRIPPGWALQLPLLECLEMSKKESKSQYTGSKQVNYQSFRLSNDGCGFNQLFNRLRPYFVQSKTRSEKKKKNELAGFWTSHTQGQTGGDASQTYKTDRRRLRWYPWTRSRSILLFYPTRVEKGCAALKIASHIIGKENEKKKKKKRKRTESHSVSR